MEKVMSVNAGSSSIKFKLYDMPEEKVICSGICERIGHDDGIFEIKYGGDKKERLIVPFKDHEAGVDLITSKLLSLKIVNSLDEIKAIGNRIVQGGKYFDKSAIANDENTAIVRKLIPLAPLHNGAHLVGINAFKKLLPSTLQTLTFDTAFHQTMEEQDYVFPIPYDLTVKYDIRRYGAHGTSHRYVSEVAIKKYLDNKPNTKIISCHLGSGASITAIKDGKCVATSMGLTPLGGIMMGTRTGDLDPSVMNYICSQTGLSVSDVYTMFNKESGFLGVSGISNDTRDVENAYFNDNNKRAKLAIDLFARRAADFIGQYFVRLGGCDLIIFTAGIGENAAYYREKVLDNLKEAFHIDYDKDINNATIKGKEGVISTKESKIKVVVIPTDEEVVIARDAYNLYKQTK